MRDRRPWYREDSELFEREEIVNLSNEAALMFVMLKGRQWKRGAIPKTAQGRRALFGGRFADVEAVWAEIEPLLKQTDEGWILQEIEDERAWADEFAIKQAKNGRLGGLAKAAASAGLANAIATAKPDSSQNLASYGDVNEDVRRKTKTETETSEKMPPPASFSIDAALVGHPELDVPAFRELWARHLAVRQGSKHKRLQPEAIASRFKLIAKWGLPAALEAMEAAAASGSQGIFKPNSNGRAQQPPKPPESHARQAIRAWAARQTGGAA